MTVASGDLASYDSYTLSGVSDYPITFQFYNEADIVVWYRSGTSGAWAKWALTTNYTITDHTEDTLSDGTVTVVDTGVTGYIVITREVNPLQEVNWDSYGSLNLPLLEVAIDRLSHMLADLKRRVLQLPYGFAEDAENLLPSASARGILGWDSSESLTVLANLPAASNGKVIGWSGSSLANLDMATGGGGEATNSNLIFFDGLSGVSPALNSYADPVTDMQYIAIGRYDDQSRIYIWDSTNSEADNGDTVIMPTSWVGSGRWILLPMASAGGLV